MVLFHHYSILLDLRMHLTFRHYRNLSDLDCNHNHNYLDCCTHYHYRSLITYVHMDL